MTIRRLNSSLRHKTSSSERGTGKDDDEELVSDIEIVQQWAAIERLPTFDRLKSPPFDKEGEGKVVDGEGKRVVDVMKLGLVERCVFLEKLIKHIEHDNLKLLRKIRGRIELVDLELPTIEAYMFMYDSTHGIFKGTLKVVDESTLEINGKQIKIFSKR
ncbi:hypothetical protein Patl1_33289 [Pistacia atlantica]|uniref:Uncharacterized protein n=1 Tax=Pistacia atlantica TaxID=434234 RepID=A0ACC1AQW7_9ROSI|nr:hypothetical protein Patl1_33289 [Pistacia atlantica]